MGGYGKVNIMEKKGLDLLTEEGRILLRNLYSLSETALLALTLIGEAFNQSIEGQVAVANVIKNRVRYWRKSYQDIILQHYDTIFQFTCWVDRGKWLFDIWKGTAELSNYERDVLRQIFYVSEGVVGGRVLSNVGKADHYYALKWMKLNMPPRWAKSMKKVGTIGDLAFLQSDRVSR